MNPILANVHHDLKIINKDRQANNIYQHAFASALIDPQSSFYFLEFNDLSEDENPAFIISINADKEKADITLFKGECQRNNLEGKKKITEVKSFGRYSIDSLSEALDFYYAKICRILDA